MKHISLRPLHFFFFAVKSCSFGGKIGFHVVSRFNSRIIGPFFTKFCAGSPRLSAACRDNHTCRSSFLNLPCVGRERPCVGSIPRARRSAKYLGTRKLSSLEQTSCPNPVTHCVVRGLHVARILLYAS
jgi:hypothetical protein